MVINNPGNDAPGDLLFFSTIAAQEKSELRLFYFCVQLLCKALRTVEYECVTFTPGIGHQSLRTPQSLSGRRKKKFAFPRNTEPQVHSSIRLTGLLSVHSLEILFEMITASADLFHLGSCKTISQDLLGCNSF